MAVEQHDLPETLSEFVDRHRDALERHADADRPASWLTAALLATADAESREEQEVDSR